MRTQAARRPFAKLGLAILLSVASLASVAPSQAQEGPAAVEQPGQDPFHGYIQAVIEAEQESDREKRCLAYPDYPGIHWPRPLVEAACARARRPVLNLVQVAELARTPRGRRRLDSIYGDLFEAHLTDPKARDQIFHSLRVFRDSIAARRVVDDWVENAPNSPFAALAQGYQRLGAVYYWSGGRPLSLLPGDTVRTINLVLYDAVNAFSRAQQMDRRLSPACVGLAEAQGKTWRFGNPLPTIERCVASDPLSFTVVAAWAASLVGDVEESAASQERLARHIEAHVGAAPELAGIPAVLLAEQTDRGSTELWMGVLKRAPDSTAFSRLSEAHLRDGDRASARAALSQAVRFESSTDRHRSDRSYMEALWIHELRLKDAAEVLGNSGSGTGSYEGVSIRLRRERNPPKTDEQGFYIEGPTPGSAEAVLKAAIEDCFNQTYLRNYQEADRCSRELVEKYPRNADAWRVRAETLYRQGHPDVKLAAAKFLRFADEETTFAVDAYAPRYRAWLEPVR